MWAGLMLGALVACEAEVPDSPMMGDDCELRDLDKHICDEHHNVIIRCRAEVRQTHWIFVQDCRVTDQQCITDGEEAWCE